MAHNPQISAAEKLLGPIEQLYRDLGDSQATIVVSHHWQPGYLTFDVLAEGERVAKLLIPATEILRHRGYGQLEASQFLFVT